ncbi:MAG: bifunctional 4-hydroxy-2-oxoglutarate aldolase/2-dehydro-3-deoxy-phosphogluconate aldolase [Sporomusaceae bacterium]|nr:bifunctional 4-hydroxy-2-oxoglutarate aldolase/2-dehydro-3-deoxy-phosphogluconate aldolase [Sporomusaceae bacterium]
MEKYQVVEAIAQTGVVAIVRGTGSDELLPIADALYDGGIRAIEVTCNTRGHLTMIQTLTAALGDKMAVGAGTVLSPAAAQLVIDAGAQFVLAPDFNPEVVQLVHQHQLLAIPGVASPTEMLAAYRLGVDIVKLFPAGALGARYLKELRGPLQQAAVMPVGGITLQNLPEFVHAGAFAFGVGGELVDKQAAARGDYAAIRDKAQAFIAAFRQAKNGSGAG